MGMISNLVGRLKNQSSKFDGTGFVETQRLLEEAAETITLLSAKLSVAEGKAKWISCSDRMPNTEEYMGFAPIGYLKRLEIAYTTDTVEYLIGFYDGSKWIDKHHNIIKNVIAWKPFSPLPEPYHE